MWTLQYERVGRAGNWNWIYYTVAYFNTNQGHTQHADVNEANFDRSLFIHLVQTPCFTRQSVKYTYHYKSTVFLLRL